MTFYVLLITVKKYFPRYYPNLFQLLIISRAELFMLISLLIYKKYFIEQLIENCEINHIFVRLRTHEYENCIHVYRRIFHRNSSRLKAFQIAIFHNELGKVACRSPSHRVIMYDALLSG